MIYRGDLHLLDYNTTEPLGVLMFFKLQYMI
jgi:hypothetical protein